MTDNALVNVTIVAGHIKQTETKPTARIGQQVTMTGHGAVMFYFTPEIARQWIGVLSTIERESE